VPKKRLLHRRATGAVGTRALATSVKTDLNTSGLSTRGGGVDVVATVVAGSTGVELGVAVVGQIAVGVDSKASGRRGTNIALELGGGRSQDTATAVSISETTVVDAVGSLSIGESRGLANSVLTVTKLANNSGLTTRGSQGEAA
jgi:hypothetical protein